MIFQFYDESTFNANDDQPTVWKGDTMQIIDLWGKGRWINVPDFIEEKNTFLVT